MGFVEGRINSWKFPYSSSVLLNSGACACTAAAGFFLRSCFTFVGLVSVII